MIARTLAGEIRRRALAGDRSLALRFTEADGRRAALTHGDLWDRAARVGAALRHRGVLAGDRVLVLAPDVEEAVAAHFGAWAAGVSPVHLGLPYRLGDPAAYIAELGRTADRLRARCLLVSRTVAPFVPAGDPRVIAIDTLLAEPPEDLDPDAAPAPDLVQLTSGSTRHPRAVVVPHARLIAHLEAIAEALPAGDAASGVSWLPLHHDMGLVGGMLYPIFTRFPVHLIAPLAFQGRPYAWLEALSEARATHTAGPPSAYAILLRLADRAAADGLRLDALRCAMIGAEPISPALLRRFAAAFAPAGFRAEAFFPVYGLAEATVAVTFPEPGAPARIEHLDRAALERDRLASPANGGASIEVTGVGRPLRGTEVIIAGASGEPLPEGHVGEILVRSETLMIGYDADPEATRAALGEGDLLHTGDLGFLREGVLFVTGRVKEVIIKGGHNLAPEPIEEITSTVDGVRPGCVAAVGVRAPGAETERVVVVAETRLEEPAHPDLSHRIRAALKLGGVAVDEVTLVPPHWLPRTTSGKLRRAEVAARLADRGR